MMALRMGMYVAKTLVKISALDGAIVRDVGSPIGEPFQAKNYKMAYKRVKDIYAYDSSVGVEKIKGLEDSVKKDR